MCVGGGACMILEGKKVRRPSLEFRSTAQSDDSRKKKEDDDMKKKGGGGIVRKKGEPSN